MLEVLVPMLWIWQDGIPHNPPWVLSFRSHEPIVVCEYPATSSSFSSPTRWLMYFPSMLILYSNLKIGWPIGGAFVRYCSNARRFSSFSRHGMVLDSRVRDVLRKHLTVVENAYELPWDFIVCLRHWARSTSNLLDKPALCKRAVPCAISDP